MLVKVTEKQFMQMVGELQDKNVQDNQYYGIITSPIFVHQATRVDDCDTEYCDTHNIFRFPVNRDGGTIVCAEGDICCFRMDSQLNVPNAINHLIALLQSKGINAGLDNNDGSIGRDVLVDNTYKVATYTNSYISDGKYFTTMIYPMTVDLDVINHICKKPMKKIPRGLNYYGITQQDIISILEDVNR